MYVAVKGGEKAIENAHKWLAETRRGDPAVAELSLDQIQAQLRLSLQRIMNEGSLYDPELAALAIKQAMGDLIEAAFLLRAYRTTLPRFGYAEPFNTDAMVIKRRISATYKDLPGGQVLGPTFDYTHRLLDFMLAAEGEIPSKARLADEPLPGDVPHVLALLDDEGLMQPEMAEDGEGYVIPDVTREPLLFPAERATRLQTLARGDEGFLLALGYSTQRGFGTTHPFVGELRVGLVELAFTPEDLGFSIVIGQIEITECEMVNQFAGSKTEPAQFTRGYGLVFGHGERKAMAMALVDRALRNKDKLGETGAPAEDEEFVLYHADNVQASGFVEHLKLPHYVDFQGELDNIRHLRKAAGAELDRQAEAAE
ncbi:MAG: carbon-phosphorus lyase complex subunit PhnI [Geminicoccaceae bacterium]